MKTEDEAREISKEELIALDEQLKVGELRTRRIQINVKTSRMKFTMNQVMDFGKQTLLSGKLTHVV